MTTSSRLSIGEFSRLTWLSAKALRLYERRGLLLPDLVDEYTGYRYYREAQAERARSIALLRRAGMPLDRIGAVLDADDGDRSAVIAEYRAETIHGHERNLALLDNVAIALGAESPPMADVGVEVFSREVAERAFVARTLHTTAAELPAHIEETARAMAQRAGQAVDRSQPLVVVYHGEVGWESDGPVEVRVPVADRAVADGVEPAGSEFFVDVPLGEVQFPTILRSFDAVRAAASRGPCRPSGHPREVYLDGDPFRCQVAQRYRVPMRA
ncbi:MerR family transcriptional regulator [Demequina muriae]|uniref:MerR family transcriptional regulator n=1 Tax=Demequina muriae TaxID=3051664 RepID=A0ABT8GEC8_9MICO|nr:MerR family transcriptional regulator [Demequina sp. EGI L300058]MDN4479788.1 MerR family transcriptional regulator [Demequina sp. EGI L300058]